MATLRNRVERLEEKKLCIWIQNGRGRRWAPSTVAGQYSVGAEVRMGTAGTLVIQAGGKVAIAGTSDYEKTGKITVTTLRGTVSLNDTVVPPGKSLSVSTFGVRKPDKQKVQP